MDIQNQIEHWAEYMKDGVHEMMAVRRLGNDILLFFNEITYNNGPNNMNLRSGFT